MNNEIEKVNKQVAMRKKMVSLLTCFKCQNFEKPVPEDLVYLQAGTGQWKISDMSVFLRSKKAISLAS